jgi:DHA1 family multidrug resistance protein-like MFS transporter
VFALSIAWRIVFFIYAGLALIGAGLACARAPKTAPSSHQRSGKRQAVFSWLFVRLVGVIFLSHFITALLRPVFYVFLQDRFTTDVRLLTLAFIPAALIESFLPSRLGRLSDRWGRTPLIIAGLGGSGLLSFVIPTASHLAWVILYWTLQTLALMAAVPPQKALVSDLTEQEDRGLGYGMYTFAASLGTALGPLLGGWSYDHLGHGVPFYLNGIALLTNPVWIFFLLRTPPRQQAA